VSEPARAAVPKQRDGVTLDVEPGRRLHEEVRELRVFGREDERSVDAIASRSQRANRSAVRLFPSVNP